MHALYLHNIKQPGNTNDDIFSIKFNSFNLGLHVSSFVLIDTYWW